MAHVRQVSKDAINIFDCIHNQVGNCVDSNININEGITGGRAIINYFV